MGDSGSEEAHEYAGSGVIEGITDGRSYRQARGWLRYSLAVYEDSEVTLGCTFRGSEGRRLTFEVLVDGVTAGSHSFQSASAAPASAEYRMPQALTAGKTVISVTIRAVDGPTPGLFELWTVQEHLEVPERTVGFRSQESGVRGQWPVASGRWPVISGILTTWLATAGSGSDTLLPSERWYGRGRRVAGPWKGEMYR